MSPLNDFIKALRVKKKNYSDDTPIHVVKETQFIGIFELDDVRTYAGVNRGIRTAVLYNMLSCSNTELYFSKCKLNELK